MCDKHISYLANKGDNDSGGNRVERYDKNVEMVRACDDMIGAIGLLGRRAIKMKVKGRRKRGRSKRRWLDRVRMISNRMDWQRRKFMTEQHGGLCHRTSTPHIYIYIYRWG